MVNAEYKFLAALEPNAAATLLMSTMKLKSGIRSITSGIGSSSTAAAPVRGASLSPSPSDTSGRYHRARGPLTPLPLQRH